MKSDPQKGVPINLFSLVAYVPDPLGRYLDGLRQELAPDSKLQTHITILPPRPLSVDVEAARKQVCSRVRNASPFDVGVGGVEMFSLTSVVYLGIVAGFPKLCELHDALNANGLEFNEPYPYHPHITVAQWMAAEQVEAVSELARRRWAEFSHERSFRLEAVTLVQGTSLGSWIDLAECVIGMAAPSA